MPEIERLNGALYNAVTGGSENIRTPTVFKATTITGGSGNYLAWTPAAGKKWRVMGVYVTASNDVSCATGGTYKLELLEGGVATGLIFPIFLPATSVTTVPGVSVVASYNLPGNGLLATTVASVLNANSSQALTAGRVQLCVWGTEE